MTVEQEGVLHTTVWSTPCIPVISARLWDYSLFSFVRSSMPIRKSHLKGHREKTAEVGLWISFPISLFETHACGHDKRGIKRQAVSTVDCSERERSRHVHQKNEGSSRDPLKELRNRQWKQSYLSWLILIGSTKRSCELLQTEKIA